MAHHPVTTTWSRRAALGMLGASGIAIAAAGCEVQTKSNSGPTTDSRAVVIPDPKVTLPTGQVAFHWMDTGDRKAQFEAPVFDAYHAKHSNITVNYDQQPWKQLNQVIPLGIRNQTAPDVFAIPNNVPAASAVSQGWVKPIEDVIPDFSTWRKAFPAGMLVPGIHIFNDKVYCFPLTSSGQLFQLLWYDTKNLNDAGVGDPASELASWDQFRAVAKKVTKAGKGKIFGIIADKTMSDFVQGLAQTAGWNTLGGMDPKTGRYAYAAQPVLDAIELGLSMQADGSFFPGFQSLTDKEVSGRLPNGVAGLYVGGPWYYQEWESSSPDWKFDLLKMPTPDGKGNYYRTYSQGGGNATWIYSKSKYPEIAADIYSYTGSLAGQTAMVELTQGALTPVIPGALEAAKAKKAKFDPYAEKIQDLSAAMCRIGPVAAVRNSATDQVKLQLKGVKPAFTDILGGLFTGQVKDAKAALTKLDEASEKDLDQAIAAAKKKGANVSRDDYIFPNFDPSKDYTEDDYKSL